MYVVKEKYKQFCTYIALISHKNNKSNNYINTLIDLRNALQAREILTYMSALYQCVY